MGRYIAAHGRAVRRIGLVPKRENGTKPHGHRHSFAKWLESLGLKQEQIRRYLHHSSVKSQETYKQLSEGEMHSEMEHGLARVSTPAPPQVYDESIQRKDQKAQFAALTGQVPSVAQPLLEEWENLSLRLEINRRPKLAEADRPLNRRKRASFTEQAVHQ